MAQGSAGSGILCGIAPEAWRASLGTHRDRAVIRLAEQLGKSYNMVNSYAQNRQQPRLEVLHDIAKILDVDVVELIVSSKKK